MRTHAGGSKSPARALKRTLLAAVMSASLFQGAAFAQSTSGDIVGTASYVSGAQIQITSLRSGVSRTVPVGSDGKFRIPALPTGTYEVDLVEGGKTVAKQQATVVAGQTVDVDFSASDLDAVVVKGTSVIGGIDTNSVESRTTFTAEQLSTLPVPHDVNNVARLTPGTSAGSQNFGNLNSFGGSSVAENSYYVNGFNVTDLYNSLSFSQVPWQAIDQIDVQTGGYGAEYGFSTGGVTSVNVKSGTNEWHGGVSVDSTPNILRAHVPDEYFNNGSLFEKWSKNTSNDNTYAVWAGGPIIKDKLFVFAIAQLERQTGTSYGARSTSSDTSASASSATDYTISQPYKLVKLDYYLNDWNHFEFTGFDNSQRYHYHYYNATFDGDNEYKTNYLGSETYKRGGLSTIFKWTSNLSDDLTMTAQFGHSHLLREDEEISPDGTVTKYNGDINSAFTGCPYVWFSSSWTGDEVTNCGLGGVGVDNGYSDRKDYKLDFTWTLGDHELKFGYDLDDFTSKEGEEEVGYYYYGSYVYGYVYKTGGTVEIKQKSWYVQDHWHITDDFLLSIGLRNDTFNNYNTDGTAYLKMANIWQPRLGFSWDINGDGRSRLYGNLGRYALPVSANVALRAASASIYSSTYYYDVTGVTSTGVPTGYDTVYGPYYSNGETGATPNAASVVSKNLKPYTQDEAILGYQYTLNTQNDFFNDWVLGAKATYRKIHNAIDDSCSTQALYEAATAAGIDTSEFTYSGSDYWENPGTVGCWLFNPGYSSTITADLDGNGTLDTVTMSASSLGPKAKRMYRAITLSAEKSTEKWYANLSYTWSQSKGNYEGLVKSAIGQSDTGTTEDFDYKELMYGSYGFLNNDHTHSFKAYGAYKFTPEWQIGLTVDLQSGAPISCYGGGYGTWGNYTDYSSAYHFCNGSISTQGSSGRTPWTFTVSPDLTWKPAAWKGFTAQLSLMNIFNNVKPLEVYEVHEDHYYEGHTYVYEYYKLGEYYTTPRYARLQLMYEW
ncbi:MAG: TonB-dependent receptor [Myxococcales bacterium]